MDSVHHIWCPLFSQEFQDLPDGAETTLTDKYGEDSRVWLVDTTVRIRRIRDHGAISSHSTQSIPRVLFR
ncbi:hypothetical protein FV295_24345 [Escherichia coli]|nr:hypothetical protein FV295_24345 [Escherichia coli]